MGETKVRKRQKVDSASASHPILELKGRQKGAQGRHQGAKREPGDVHRESKRQQNGAKIASEAKVKICKK